MMMEAHLAARFETSGLRLADVVHERRQTQGKVRGRHRTVGAGFQRHCTVNDDHGVLEYILMAMMFVDLQLQRRDFRKDDIGKTGIDQRLDTRTRTI